MKPTVKPYLLKLGHDYEYGYEFESRRVIVRLIKTSPKGYKFFNMKTSQCLQMPAMYPSKEPNHISKGETWFFMSNMLHIVEIPNVDDLCDTIVDSIGLPLPTYDYTYHKYISSVPQNIKIGSCVTGIENADMHPTFTEACLRIIHWHNQNIKENVF
jgi:hypothetical protein